MTKPVGPVKTKSPVPPAARVIGSNLINLRRIAALSQEQLGCFMGVSHQQIQKYENGQNRLSIEKLFQLKHFYNVPYEVFFEGLEADIFDESARKDLSVYLKLQRLGDKSLKQKIEKILHILLD